MSGNSERMIAIVVGPSRPAMRRDSSSFTESGERCIVATPAAVVPSKARSLPRDRRHAGAKIRVWCRNPGGNRPKHFRGAAFPAAMMRRPWNIDDDDLAFALLSRDRAMPSAEDFDTAHRRQEGEAP